MAAEEGQVISCHAVDEICLPNGLLPLDEMIEVGYSRSTGFVWLKIGKKEEHRAATGVVLGGSAKFYSETINIIIIRMAIETSQTLHNMTGALKDIESKLEGSSVGEEASDILTSTFHKLDTESALIEMQASNNRFRIGVFTEGGHELDCRGMLWIILYSYINISQTRLSLLFLIII
ncbi:hypothetical protein K1719_013253 [Acacia pycnantha]|nr:hypothetical protein K1719_013253 [Acacia pycnantha]